MRVAALYDIHGNLPALESVLEELQHFTVDQIVVGGDVLSGPMQVECIERLQALSVPVHYLMGNSDREVIAARHGNENKKLPPFAQEMLRWSARQLAPEHEQWIASWPILGGVVNVVADALAPTAPEAAAVLQGVARHLSRHSDWRGPSSAETKRSGASSGNTGFFLELRRKTSSFLVDSLGEVRLRELRAEGEAMDNDHAVAWVLDAIAKARTVMSE